jgi:hypothetical protein
MIRINLIPEPERKEVRGTGEIFMGICVLAALFAVIAAIHILQGNKIEEVNRGIARAEKRIKELEVVKKKVDSSGQERRAQQENRDYQRAREKPDGAFVRDGRPVPRDPQQSLD